VSDRIVRLSPRQATECVFGIGLSCTTQCVEGKGRCRPRCPHEELVQRESLWGPHLTIGCFHHQYVLHQYRTLLMCRKPRYYRRGTTPLLNHYFKVHAYHTNVQITLIQRKKSKATYIYIYIQSETKFIISTGPAGISSAESIGRLGLG
jgi:hypothetical protein